MRRLLLAVLSLAPLALVLACGDAEPVSAAPESDLIGGRLAKEGEFPATLLIKGNCTATRVGPRHILTAAHCVNGQSMFAVGATIAITSNKVVGRFAASDGAAPDAAGDAASTFKPYTIEKALLSPSWTALCPKLTSCGSVHVSGRNNMADAALIVVREEITDIPQAAIDLSPVDPSDAVVVTGYGCEDKVGGSWDYSHQRLKVAATKAQPFDAVLHPGSFMFETDRPTGLLATMAGIYIVTPGPAFVAQAPDAGVLSEAGASRDGAAIRDAAPPPPPNLSLGGLCPGDSGGPLYRADSAGLTVVGINSNYTFSSGNPFSFDGHSYVWGGSPVTNWHTRVDGARGLAAGTWLKEQGVKTVCTRGRC